MKTQWHQYEKEQDYETYQGTLPHTSEGDLMIQSFNGENRFLSNFYPCDISDVFMLHYHSVEAAYQASKTMEFEEREQFSKITNPAYAKALGKKLILRDDWNEVKLRLMTNFIRQKFAFGSELAQMLIDTENEELIEGSWWGDKYWGVCNGKGENHLGKILMARRLELKIECE